MYKTTGLLSARATELWCGWIPSGSVTHSEPRTTEPAKHACGYWVGLAGKVFTCSRYVHCTLGFVWDCKCRLSNGCGNNRLTKSVFLYSQVDPDLNATPREGGEGQTVLLAGLGHGCFLDSSSKGYICFQAAHPCLCNMYSISFSLWALYSVIYVIYTISLNQTEEKPWVMHKTEFFQIQDERLFPKYLFAMDFSYHFYFFPHYSLFLVPVSKCQSDALRVSFKNILSYSLGTHCGQFKGKSGGLL